MRMAIWSWLVVVFGAVAVGGKGLFWLEWWSGYFFVGLLFSSAGGLLLSGEGFLLFLPWGFCR